jgi:hypothetical protein
MSNEKNPELNIEPPIVDKSNFEPTEADILKLHYKATYGIIKKIYDSNNKIPQEELVKQAKDQFLKQFPDEQIPEDVLKAFVKYIVISSVLRNDPERKITEDHLKEAEQGLRISLAEAGELSFSEEGGKRKKRTRKRKIHKKKSHKKKSKTHRKKHHKKTHRKY